MPDGDFLSDEQIRQSTGGEFRVPPGVPKATCLNCGREYWASYAVQSHDCLIELGKIDRYCVWLVLFQRLGFGVLKTPEDAKFDWMKRVSGRKALTNHLQTDLLVGPGYEIIDWYGTKPFNEALFPAWKDEDSAPLILSPFLPRTHEPEFDKQATPGIDAHRNS